MDPRTRAVAALLAIVVLATGCVALPGASQPYETPLDAATVSDNHQTALDEAGTYTVTINQSATLNGDVAGESNISAAVDATEDRAAFETSSIVGPVGVYIDDGTAYQRIGDDDPQYRTVDAPAVGEVLSTEIEPTIRNKTFTANGTTMIAGETVWVYTANSTDRAGRDLGLADSVSIESVDVTLYVREDGLVVRQISNATISVNDGLLSGSFVQTTTYSDVGTTTVESPDWLDDAKNASTA